MRPSSTPVSPTSALTRKLAWYGAAAGVAGLTPAVAHAQIVYRDLVPDVTVMDNDLGFPIDFDNDGDPELLLRELTADSYSLMNIETTLGPDSLNAVAGTNVGPYTYLVPLALNTPINAAGVIPVNPYASFTYTSLDPNAWIGLEAFAGVRFELQDGEHFGWIRIEFPTAGQYIVKDMAYQSTVGAAINAGDDGTTAVEPGALPNGYLFTSPAPHPVTGRSTFDLAVGQSEHVRVHLIDVTGRQVATVLDATLPALVRQRVALDTTALPSGVYVLRVAGDTFVTTRRVVVAH